MTHDDITALFVQRHDAWARRDADGLAATHSEQSVSDSPMQGKLVGRARIRAVYAEWFDAFPDLTFTSRRLIIDGTRVAELCTLRGTQSNPFHGVPATARRVDFKGAWFYTIGPDGLIAEDERVYDVTRVLMQLGLLKAKPSAPEMAQADAERVP
jgi:steroid delta-isomerase-like uncharacterized protein